MSQTIMAAYSQQVARQVVGKVRMVLAVPQVRAPEQLVPRGAVLAARARPVAESQPVQR